MGSAAQNQDVPELFEAAGLAGLELEATGTDGAAGVRQAASERLAAHRQRRAQAQAQIQAKVAATAERKVATQEGAARVRDAVAARYQNSVSYREFLAQEAGIALEKAQAEAEIAARNAKAVAEVQTQLLHELAEYRQPDHTSQQEEARDTFLHAMADIAVAATDAMHLTPRLEAAPAGLTVRLFEDLRGGSAAASAPSSAPHDANEWHALDAEIAFRLAPEFAEPAPAAASIAGNVIQFPRQIVAPRKVRPRLAEGPLLEESAAMPQLRIFEVESEQVSSVPAMEPAAAPDWQTLKLDAMPRMEEFALQSELAAPAVTIDAARLPLRVMANAVDSAIVACSAVAMLAVAAETAGAGLRLLPHALLGASAGLMLAALFAGYHLIFFALAGATPGMRYARVGFCTFADANPTHRALAGRCLASALSLCPLGLGFAWAWLDEERLGWHDRLSRTYLRAY